MKEKKKHEADFRVYKKVSSVYGFNVVDIHGKNVSLSDYRGKVMIIVNTARKSWWAYQA